MGIRFRKSIKMGPVRLNLSKSGVGASIGVKGARVGIGPRGLHSTVTIPGTGVSFTSAQSLKRRKESQPIGQAVDHQEQPVIESQSPEAQKTTMQPQEKPPDRFVFWKLIANLILLVFAVKMCTSVVFKKETPYRCYRPGDRGYQYPENPKCL